MIKKGIYIFLFTGLLACTSTLKNNKAEKNAVSDELTKAKMKVPGITFEDLKAGKRMYIRNCSGCHALKDPAKYTTQQWQPILTKMFEKAKIKDTAQQELIANYVIANSK